VAQIFWAEGARSAVDQLILSHSLPADTRERVKRSLLPLARFPRLGPEIAQLEDGKELHFLIGPWPWLVLVYIFDEATDLVTVVSPEDGRSATSSVTRNPPP
jgi:hypothetical protein